MSISTVAPAARAGREPYSPKCRRGDSTAATATAAIGPRIRNASLARGSERAGTVTRGILGGLACSPRQGRAQGASGAAWDEGSRRKLAIGPGDG